MTSVGFAPQKPYGFILKIAEELRYLFFGISVASSIMRTSSPHSLQLGTTPYSPVRQRWTVPS